MSQKSIRNYLLNDRRLSVIVFSLFFSWLLAFPFQGQILHSIASDYDINPKSMIFCGITAHFCGILLFGFIVKTMKTARQLMLGSIIFCILASVMFFFPPSVLWITAIIASSFLTGGCVAAWGFFFKSGTPRNERIKTAADGLIYSNLLMIVLNTAAAYISAKLALALSMFFLTAAFVFAMHLPKSEAPDHPSVKAKNSVSIVKPLVFLCVFIVVITINSGLMYQVQGPAFSHLEGLAAWYWAVPYIAALFIMRNLSRKTNRTYILYVAIAMIGLSFIGFMSFDRSALSYLLVNTLMLGACGVYDLFWWSILGEMLDLDKNPAKVLGIGLSANVLGVLIGSFLGNGIAASDQQSPVSSLIALTVVCITLVLLPLLHKYLLSLLKDHTYLSVLSDMQPDEKSTSADRLFKLGNLSERESQVAALLLQGKTYRTIAGELYISENTVKYYVKNIYSKINIQSRSELIDLALKKENV